ncbi:MAG: RsmB/NOP family class I SAM-dependent RNA methyltransferase [Desulfurococcaceae archaeon]
MSRPKDLHEILREIYVEPSREAYELALKYGYLPYMVQRYIDMLGYRVAVLLLESFEKPPKPVVRVNTLLITPKDLKNRLEQLGFQLEEIRWSSEAFHVKRAPHSPSIGATHEYLKGFYYVHKDATSLIPVMLLLHGYEGDVLDACAAPGGKATYIAQILKSRGKGVVYANDLVLYRLKSLVGHVMRLKLDNVVVLWSDARKLPMKIGRTFDRVLLDAPCSGEGRISVDPGRKTRTSVLDLAIMVKREIELLWSLVDIVSEGGIIAYVTCSIAPEENEYVVNEVLRGKGGLEVVEPPLRLLDYSKGLTEYRNLKFSEEMEYCIRIWPFKHELFGYYICLLRKKS